jgi:hypothetical protein
MTVPQDHRLLQVEGDAVEGEFDTRCCEPAATKALRTLPLSQFGKAGFDDYPKTLIFVDVHTGRRFARPV